MNKRLAIYVRSDRLKHVRVPLEMHDFLQARKNAIGFQIHVRSAF
jgi:hypothetical protein